MSFRQAQGNAEEEAGEAILHEYEDAEFEEDEEEYDEDEEEIDEDEDEADLDGQVQDGRCIRMLAHWPTATAV